MQERRNWTGKVGGDEDGEETVMQYRKGTGKLAFCKGNYRRKEKGRREETERKMREKRRW